MPIVYTNRKGVTYYLCCSPVAGGKRRYYFTREARGEPVEEIPRGYQISESVNGVVSLVKKRDSQVLPAEVGEVKAVWEQDRSWGEYRVEAEQDRIVVYEQVGLGVGELVERMVGSGLLDDEERGRVKEYLESRTRYTPLLRFDLVDEEQRLFAVCRKDERGWGKAMGRGRLEELMRIWVPRPYRVW